MLNHVSLDKLAQIAMQSIRHADTKPTSHSDQDGHPYECKVWRFNGFSDSTIYRLAVDCGTFAIRSWPNRFDTPSKVAFWSGVNAAFGESSERLIGLGSSSSTPFPSLYRWHPQGEPVVTLLHFEGRLWTLSDWVPGRPIAPRNASKSLVCHLATVLGRLHAHSIDARDQDGLPLGQQSIRSNSIRERRDALKSLDHSLFRVIDDDSFFSTYVLSDRVKHCIAIIFERGPDWHRFLKICEGQTRTCHWIVRDLWRENVLVDDLQRFSSIVDLGAARFDWPGLDFVRLFGSLSYCLEGGLITVVVEKSDLWTDAYAAYTFEHANHAIESLDECQMLHVVSTGLSILQWVQWIKEGTLDLKQLDKAQRVSGRIAELCDQFLIEAS